MDSGLELAVSAAATAVPSVLAAAIKETFQKGRNVKAPTPPVLRLTGALPEDAFLRTIPEDLLVDLLRAGRVQRLDRGVQLETHGPLHFVLTGWLLETRGYANGTMGTVLLGPGDIVGLDALLTGEAGGTVESLAQVSVLTISRRHFDALLEANPSAWRWVARAIALKSQEMKRAYATVSNPAAERINEFLYSATRKWPLMREDAFVINGISQDTIAKCLRLSSASVEAQLKALREEGVITSGYRSINVHDVNYLRAYALDHQDHETALEDGTELSSSFAPKVRVYQIAKALNVGSKDILSKLHELGIFPRSASSLIEDSDVRRLEQALGKRIPLRGFLV